MEYNEDAQKEKITFLIKFHNDLSFLINTITGEIEGGGKNSWLNWIAVDYVQGTAHEGMFFTNLRELNKNFDEFEKLIPILPEPKSNFRQKLTEILSISIDYKNDYESRINGRLKQIIQNEAKKYLTTYIDTTHFLNTNQFRKLYEICCKVKAVIINHNKGIYDELIGFVCNLPQKTVKDIFTLMDGTQISCEAKDFIAIFCLTPSTVNKPVKWLVKHGKQPNKTALFSFLKLMLGLEEMPREILRQSNRLFIFGDTDIFPDKYTYPSRDEQKSTLRKHFKQVKDIIIKTRPQ